MVMLAGAWGPCPVSLNHRTKRGSEGNFDAPPVLVSTLISLQVQHKVIKIPQCAHGSKPMHCPWYAAFTRNRRLLSLRNQYCCCPCIVHLEHVRAPRSTAPPDRAHTGMRAPAKLRYDYLPARTCSSHCMHTCAHIYASVGPIYFTSVIRHKNHIFTSDVHHVVACCEEEEEQQGVADARLDGRDSV